MAPALSKEFLDIQATVECGFTLKFVRDMIKTYNVLKDFQNMHKEYIISTLSTVYKLHILKKQHQVLFTCHHLPKISEVSGKLLV